LNYTPYSYSKQETYYSCPLKFKFTYIDKIKIPQSNIALEKGSYLHFKLEELFSNALGIPFNEVFNFVLIKDEEINVVTSLALNICKSEYQQRLLNLAVNSDEVGIEAGFSFDDDWVPSGYVNNCVIRGYIDLYMVKGISAIVCDFKSGKYKEPKYQTYDQVMLYALWIFKTYPQVQSVKGIYNYVETGQQNTKTYTRIEMGYIEHYFKDKLLTIEHTSEFSKKVTKLCLWCDFYKQDYCKLSDPELTKIL